MSMVVMKKMLSKIKCLLVFLKEGTSSGWVFWEERQNTGAPQPTQSRGHSMIYVEVKGEEVVTTISGRLALQCINKLVSVLD